jgi:hypothetical protein
LGKPRRKEINRRKRGVQEERNDPADRVKVVNRVSSLAIQLYRNCYRNTRHKIPPAFAHCKEAPGVRVAESLGCALDGH